MNAERCRIVIRVPTLIRVSNYHRRLDCLELISKCRCDSSKVQTCLLIDKSQFDGMLFGYSAKCESGYRFGPPHPCVLLAGSKTEAKCIVHVAWSSIRNVNYPPFG